MSGGPSRAQPSSVTGVLPLRRSHPDAARDRSLTDEPDPTRAASGLPAPQPSGDAAAVTRTFAAPAALLAQARRPAPAGPAPGARRPPPATGAGERRRPAAHDSARGTLPELAIGSVVAGRYRILSHLGDGGSATISLALFRGTGHVQKLVVLKYPRRTRDGQSDVLDELVAEARLAAQMSHQHVVQVHEIVEHAGAPVLVMEHLDGCSLASLLAATRGTSAFDLPLRLSVLSKVLAGLHYTHEVCDLSGRPLHVVHRDVSPQNVLLTYEGQVKLIDFGIALSSGHSRSAMTQAIAGKLGYMAPEQVRGSADRRADIFAAGIMLWELVTLRRFWGKAPLAAVMRRLLDADVPRLGSLEADLGPELAGICRRALAPSRDQRYPTALLMQAELERVLRSRAPLPTEPALGEIVERSFGKERLARRRQVRRLLLELDGGPRASAAAPQPSAPGRPRGRRRGWERATTGALLALLAAQSGDAGLDSPRLPLETRRASTGQSVLRAQPSPAPSPPRAAAERRAPLHSTGDAPPRGEPQPRVAPPARARDARRPERTRAEERRPLAASRAPGAPRTASTTRNASVEIEPGVDLRQLVRAPSRAPLPERGR